MLWHQGSRGRRVAFTVSRRVGGAVDRNRARRRLREAYRRCQGMQPGGIEVVFVGRSVALSIPFPRLLGDMQDALRGLTRAVVRPAPNVVRE
jgi:ribonuclease P protein component